MPKIRTNRSAAKRFKKTGSGRIKRARAYARHQMRAKTTKTKRKLRKTIDVASQDLPAVRRLVPYL